MAVKNYSSGMITLEIFDELFYSRKWNTKVSVGVLRTLINDNI